METPKKPYKDQSPFNKGLQGCPCKFGGVQFHSLLTTPIALTEQNGTTQEPVGKALRPWNLERFSRRNQPDAAEKDELQLHVGFKVQGCGFRACGLGLRIYGLGLANNIWRLMGRSGLEEVPGISRISGRRDL